MTVTFDEFDMAVRTRVTEGTTVTVSDRQHATSGAAPLEHWSYRGAGPDTIAVRVDGAVQRHALTAQPTPGALDLGVHAFAIMPVDPFTTHRDLGADLDDLPVVPVVRVGIPWRALQPSSSSWGSEATYWDAVLADLDTRGCKVVLTVGTAPDWTGGGPTTPPSDPADFAGWVDALLDRWANTVEMVALDPWNEPNHSEGIFFDGTPQDYLDLLRATKAAAAGRVPISLGSLALADTAYIETLFDLGMTGDDFDTVDLHPYAISFDPAAHWVPPDVPPTNPADVPSSLIAGVHSVEAVLADHGITGRDVIISEYGFPSNPVDAGDPHLRITDGRALEWLRTAIDQASRMSSVVAFCVHEASDVVTAGTSFMDGWGLIRFSRTWRAKRAALEV